jgi:acyl dehydratase
MATRVEPVPAADITPEDFAAGVPFITLGRTITEADVVGFAALSGDQNPQHCDLEWATNHSIFGQRIAHGLLVTSIVVGMIPPRIRNMGRPAGSAGVFKKPVFFGDTIHLVGRVLRHKATEDGLAPAEWRVINQRGELVSKVRWDFQLEDDGPLVTFDQPLTPSVDLTMDETLDGVPYRTPGRTMTEAHVTGFCAMTGDWHPEHTDAAYAKTTPLGTRSVPPMLIISSAASMFPLDVPRLIAARRAQFRYHKDLAIGGTIYVEGQLTSTTPAEDVYEQQVHAYRCVDEHGELLSSLTLNLLLTRRS